MPQAPELPSLGHLWNNPANVDSWHQIASPIVGAAFTVLDRKANLSQVIVAELVDMHPVMIMLLRPLTSALPARGGSAVIQHHDPGRGKTSFKLVVQDLRDIVGYRAPRVSLG